MKLTSAKVEMIRLTVSPEKPGDNQDEIIEMRVSRVEGSRKVSLFIVWELGRVKSIFRQCKLNDVRHGDVPAMGVVSRDWLAGSLKCTIPES